VIDSRDFIQRVRARSLVVNDDVETTISLGTIRLGSGLLSTALTIREVSYSEETGNPAGQPIDAIVSLLYEIYSSR